MATIDVAQFKENVHIPKDEFRHIITQVDLNKSELRVMCYLMTIIEGYNKSRRMGSSGKYVDPKNFTKVDAKLLAKELGYEKSKVKEALDSLFEKGILEKGDSQLCKNGYRFTF